MSTIPQILTAIDTRINVVLSGYKKLKYCYELEKNDSRGASKSYGVVSGAATSVTGTNRTVTLDQQFGVIITRSYGKRASEAAEKSAIDEIYTDIELLYRDFFQSKLGISNIVYLVSELSLDEPEPLGDNVISIRMNFTVKHRQLT
jgi:hypothetical protein